MLYKYNAEKNHVAEQWQNTFLRASYTGESPVGVYSKLFSF